jgi:hypothetical protein
MQFKRINKKLIQSIFANIFSFCIIIILAKITIGQELLSLKKLENLGNDNSLHFKSQLVKNTSDLFSLVNTCGGESALRSGIISHIQTLKTNKPAYRSPLTSFFRGQLNYSAYKQASQLSVGMHGIATQYLVVAIKSVDRGNLTRGCEYYQKSLQASIVVNNLQSIATNIYIGNLTNTSEALRQASQMVLFTINTVIFATCLVGEKALIIGIIFKSLKISVESTVSHSLDGIPITEALKTQIIDQITNELIDIQLGSGDKSIKALFCLLDYVKSVDYFSCLMKNKLNLKGRAALNSIIGAIIFTQLSTYDIATRTTITAAITSNLLNFECKLPNQNTNLNSVANKNNSNNLNFVSENLALVDIASFPKDASFIVGDSVNQFSVEFAENIELVNSGNTAVSITDNIGNVIPVTNQFVNGSTLFINILNSLQVGRSYKVTLASNTVKNSLNIFNEQLQFGFFAGNSTITTNQEVIVSNTGGVGLRLRNSPSISGTQIAGMPENTRLTIIGGPVLADGYQWWNVTGQFGTGWSATGEWLLPLNSSGIHPRGQARISNRGGLPIEVWSEIDSTNPIGTLSEGTNVNLIEGPFFQDGFFNWKVQNSNIIGYVRTATWLVPYNTNNQQLSISNVESSVNLPVRPNENISFEISVRDANGLPVQNATITGNDGLRGVSINSLITDSAGKATYFTSVPFGLASGSYSLNFIATKAGFTQSQSFSTNVQVLPLCSYQTSLQNIVFESIGGMKTIYISAPTGCSWNASTTSNFVTFSSSQNGSGNGYITIDIAPNSSNARNSIVSINGQTVSISQAAGDSRIDVLVNNIDLATNFDVQGNNVFIADQTFGIVKVDTTTKNRTAILSQSGINILRTDAQNMYFGGLIGGQYRIYKKPISGGVDIELSPLGGLNGPVMDIDTSDNFQIFYTMSSVQGQSNTGQIIRVLKQGGTNFIVGNNQNTPFGIKLKNQYVYATNQYGESPVFQYTITGNVSNNLGISANAPGIDTDELGHNLFWAYKSDSNLQNQGKIYKLTVVPSGGSPVVIADNLQTPWDLQFDNDNIFFIERSSSDVTPDGKLKMVSKNGGVVTTLIDNLRDPIALKIDHNNFYILLRGNRTSSGGSVYGALLKISKSILTQRIKSFDYDGDGKSDVSVFRASDGGWYIQRSQAGFYAVAFGQTGDKIVPADFSGDGRTDVAIFRPSDNTWYVFDTSNNTFYGIPFGTTGDIPVPADFDGDGKADINVFRPSTGFWFRNNSSNGQFVATPFGQNGDVPTVGDFDGDGKADIGVWRPSNGAWYRLNSNNNSFFAVAFGQTGDKVVPADYTGDGKTDVAVYRAGTWYILRSEDLTFYGIPFGLATDIPSPGDFDGDGKADQAVYRNGQWFIQQSTSGFIAYPFGLTGDIPTESAYVY